MMILLLSRLYSIHVYHGKWNRCKYLVGEWMITRRGIILLNILCKLNEKCWCPGIEFFFLFLSFWQNFQNFLFFLIIILFFSFYFSHLFSPFSGLLFFLFYQISCYFYNLIGTWWQLLAIIMSIIIHCVGWIWSGWWEDRKKIISQCVFFTL